MSRFSNLQPSRVQLSPLPISPNSLTYLFVISPGWGGEDDDLSRRLHTSGYSIVRYDPSISRYSMLRHRKEAATSRVSVDDQSESTSSVGDVDRDPTDGVRQVDYSVVKSSLKPLFSHVVLKL